MSSGSTFFIHSFDSYSDNCWVRTSRNLMIKLLPPYALKGMVFLIRSI